MIHMTDIIDVRRTLFAQSRYLDIQTICSMDTSAMTEVRGGGKEWGSIVTQFKLCGVG